MPKLVTIVVVVVCLATFAILFWLFRNGNDGPDETLEVAERESTTELTGSLRDENGTDPTPTVLPRLADVSQRCSGLFSVVPSVVDLQSGERQLGDDCMQALDALFLDAEVSTTVVRLDAPMTWRDVFDDLGRKEKSVRSAIEEPSCRVGNDRIRRELSERCSARDMAELAVFREICGHVKSGSRRYYVSACERRSSDTGRRLSGIR